LVISWTRLLGTARVAIHSHDDPLIRQIDEALHGQARLSVERGIHRADGATPPHLALVDLDSAHSIETLRAYSQGVRAIPAIALSRGSDLQPRLAAFANGADDVITVPVAGSEIAARIRALLRRSYGERLAFVPAVKVGDLEIDVMENRVRCGAVARRAHRDRYLDLEAPRRAPGARGSGGHAREIVGPARRTEEQRREVRDVGDLAREGEHLRSARRDEDGHRRR